MISIEEFDIFIQNNIVYEQNILYYIDDLGKDHLIKNIGQLHSIYGKSVKLESAEKYNLEIFNLCKSFDHPGPVTCHIFRSCTNSKSFPKHTDPDDVLLLMISGKKDIIIDNKRISLEEGNKIFIPADTLHEAINTSDSLMLSIGFEKFLIDKI